jgi:hypothetical protein
LLLSSFYRRPRSRRVNTTPLRGVPRMARLRFARQRGAGPLGRKASASRPAQPDTARSQTFGADPSRRPAVSLFYQRLAGRQRSTAIMTIIRTTADLTCQDVRRIKRGRYEILAIETQRLGQGQTTEILWHREDAPNAIRVDELPF